MFSRKSSNPLFFIFFFITAIVLHLNTLSSFFLADDFQMISDVSHRGPFDFRIFFEHGLFFRPLTLLVFYLDYCIWNTMFFGFHLTNLFLHSVCAFLIAHVSYYLFRVFHKDSPPPVSVAFYSAFIFLVLPNHAEVVTWISARGDSLAAVFFLTSLLFYLKYKFQDRPSFLIISGFSYFMALLSKESVVILPLLIAGIEVCIYWVGNKKNNLGFLILMVGITSVYAVIRILVIGELFGGYPGMLSHQMFNLSKLPHHLILMLTRVWIPFLPVTSNSVHLFLAVCLMLLVFFFFYLICRKKEELIFCIFLLFGAVLSLLPVLKYGVSNYSDDRFLYLSTIFYSLFIAYFFWIVFKRVFFYHGVCVLSILFLASTLLSINGMNRKMAGEVSKKIMESVGSISEEGRVFVLNVPCKVRGFHLFTKTVYFEKGLPLFNLNRPSLYFLTHHEVWSNQDQLEVTPIDRKTFDFTWLPENKDRAPYFVVHESRKAVARIENDLYLLSRINDRTYRVFFKNLEFHDKIFYFSQGTLHRLI